MGQIYEVERDIHLPETDYRREYPLFAGVRRVLVATENPRKLEAVSRFVSQYGPVVGCNESLPVAALPTYGREPNWHSAVRVAIHKVEDVVNQIRGRTGASAMAYASDVVVSTENRYLANLSREKGALNGGRLEEELETLQEEFSRDVEVRWEVACAVSTKRVKLVTGSSHSVLFGPIPADLIRDAFHGDVGAVLGRATRIPLIELFDRFIKGSAHSPLIAAVDDLGDVSDARVRRTQEIYNFYNPDHIGLVQKEVLGGVPAFPQRLQSLLNAVPARDCGDGWYLV